MDAHPVAGQDGRRRDDDGCDGIVRRDVCADGKAVDPEQFEQCAAEKAGEGIVEEQPDGRTGNHGPGDHDLERDPVQTDDPSRNGCDQDIAEHGLLMKM